MKKNFSKGFLGPIGDDLPSLIPLIFALIVFFYSFTITWNVFDARNRQFNDSLAVLELGTIMRGNSYIEGISKFNENCEKAKSVRLKFKIGLVPLPTNPLAEANPDSFDFLKIADPGAPPIREQFFSEGANVFLCENPADEEIPRGYGLRFFPVALERNVDGKFFVQPMLLVVVTWQ